VTAYPGGRFEAAPLSLGALHRFLPFFWQKGRQTRGIPQVHQPRLFDPGGSASQSPVIKHRDAEYQLPCIDYLVRRGYTAL